MTQNVKSPWMQSNSSGLFAFLVHSLLVILVFSVILSTRSKSPEIDFLAFLFFLIDFPVGCIVPLLAGALDPVVGNSPEVVANVILPAVLFGILGGFQYYLLGRTIGSLALRRKYGKLQPPVCSGCGYDLSESKSRCPECGLELDDPIPEQPPIP